MGARQDNPQTIRIRQHFEKKNKKYSQELAILQVSLSYQLCQIETIIEKIGGCRTTVGRFRPGCFAEFDKHI